MNLVMNRCTACSSASRSLFVYLNVCAFISYHRAALKHTHTNTHSYTHICFLHFALDRPGKTRIAHCLAWLRVFLLCCCCLYQSHFVCVFALYDLVTIIRIIFFLPHIFTITSSAMSASSAVFEVFVCIGNRELIFNKNKRHTISLCVESRFSRNRHNPQAFRGHTPLIISTLRQNHVLTNTFLRCFRWKSGSKTADRSTRKWWRPPRDREPVVCHWVHRTPDRTVPTINQCIRVSHHNDWIIQTAYISQKYKYG